MLAPAPPAHTTVRGFNGTPVTSGDEDSDGCTTPQLRALEGSGSLSGSRSGSARRVRSAAQHAVIDDVVSANCSPLLRPAASPAVSGIGKLRMQLEDLNLGATGTSSTAASSRASTMTIGDGSAPRRVPSTLSLTVGKVRTPRRHHKQSGSGSGSGDDTGSEGTVTYEVNLENDFVSDSNASEEDGGDDVFTDVAPDSGSATRRHHKMMADDFEPLRCLGKGTYGTVLLVKQRTTGRLYAQKQFKKASLVVHKKLVEQTKTERQILESVNRHPFVVNLYYAFQDREKLYLILEYGQGGELFTHLSTEKMFPERTAAFYMAEMVLALSHLHENLGVVYRDLKPENCLLDAEGHLLLTDFGLSKVAVDPDACNSMLGTVEYMAPEVIQGKKYGKAVDWWSFGALGYDLMTGSPPFCGPNHAKTQEKIVHQKLVLPYFLGPDAKDLLTRLLQKNPARRLGSHMPKDLATLRKHRFFRRIDWARLEARELEPPIQPMITDPELAENFAPQFTELSLSPVVSRFDEAFSYSTSAGTGDAKDDPFGGFSFVAPSSLLERDGFKNF